MNSRATIHSSVSAERLLSPTALSDRTFAAVPDGRIRWNGADTRHDPKMDFWMTKKWPAN
jgi:hypothetical protein